jgi:hypothetical protein
MRALPLLCLLAVAACPAGGQQPAVTNRDPDAARLVTSDIGRFWAAYDGATLATAGQRFDSLYLAPGTPGLHGFVRGRIAAGRMLAATIASRPRFYASIREVTMAIDTAATVRIAIRQSFHRLRELYPAAVFPDVYFVVGRLNSGGTAVPAGLVIGAEMYARTPGTPVDELSSWERAVVTTFDVLPAIVAHELVHYQQAPSLERTLLARALREGAADFVGELISGQLLNRAQHAWAAPREAALWAEFRAARAGTDVSRWLYQGDQAGDRPADLGYWMGYRICQAFYERAADKRAAVARILAVTDAEAFLAESGYAGPRR